MAGGVSSVPGVRSDADARSVDGGSVIGIIDRRAVDLACKVRSVPRIRSNTNASSIGCVNCGIAVGD